MLSAFILLSVSEAHATNITLNQDSCEKIGFLNGIWNDPNYPDKSCLVRGKLIEIERDKVLIINSGTTLVIDDNMNNIDNTAKITINYKGAIQNSGTIINNGTIFTNYGWIDNKANGIIENYGKLLTGNGGITNSGGLRQSHNEPATIINRGEIQLGLGTLYNRAIIINHNTLNIGFPTSLEEVEVENTGELYNNGIITINTLGGISNESGILYNNLGGVIDNFGKMANTGDNDIIDNRGIINNLEQGLIDNSSGKIINELGEINIDCDAHIILGTITGDLPIYACDPKNCEEAFEMRIITPIDSEILNTNSPEIKGEVCGTSQSIDIIARIDGTLWYHETFSDVSTPNTWSFSPSHIFDGNHILTIKIEDFMTGNSKEESISFTIDTTSPIVSIDSPSESETLIQREFTMTGTASDEISGIEKIEINIDNSGIFLDADGTNTWSIDLTDMSDGAHAIMARATDFAGNIGERSINITVSGPCITEKKAFVTERNTGKLLVVDLESRITNVEDGISNIVTTDLNKPRHLVLNTQESNAFIAAQPNSISIIDIEPLGEKIKELSITSHDSGSGIDINTLEDKVYITDSVNGKLFEVDIATGDIDSEYDDLTRANAVVLNNAGDTAFVATNNGFTGFIVIIDLEAKEVTSSIRLGGDIGGIALSPTEDALYVTQIVDGSLVKVDLETESESQILSGLDRPGDIAINVAGNIAYLLELGAGSLTKIDLETDPPEKTIIADGFESPSGIALSCKAFPKIEIPIRWCGLNEAPSISTPEQVGETDKSDVLSARLDRANDNAYEPKAFISLFPGTTTTSPDFKYFDDPNTSIGQSGDVFYEFLPDGSCNCDEFNEIINECRMLWENDDDTVNGITAVQIKKFVNPHPVDSPTLGLSTVGGDEVMVSDNAFQLPCPMQPSGNCMLDPFIDTDPMDKVLAHEIGHSLSLRHGNGIDDNGDGIIDNKVENDEEFGPNLMQTDVNQIQITKDQRYVMRSYAVSNIGDIILETGPLPFISSRSDKIGDTVEEYIDIDEFGVRIKQDTTEFFQSINGLLPENISDLNYFFVIDTDNNSSTGGIPTSVGVQSGFRGIDLIGQVTVDVNTDVVTISPTVWKFEDNTFEIINDASIHARIITNTLASFTVDSFSHDLPKEAKIGQEIILEISNDSIEEITKEFRMESIAQSDTGQFDTAFASLNFDQPIFSRCMTIPSDYCFEDIIIEVDKEFVEMKINKSCLMDPTKCGYVDLLNIADADSYIQRCEIINCFQSSGPISPPSCPICENGMITKNTKKIIQPQFPPLKQFKVGIQADEILPKEDYILLISPEREYPISVSPDSAELLMERNPNWELINNN